MTNSINCPICGNLCSTQASACPKCGHPIARETASIQNQKLPEFVAQTKSPINSQPARIGGALRSVLWVFFSISLLYALGTISILIDMPYSDGGYGDSLRMKSYISIVFHLVPLIIMVIVLALTYSAKERD